MNRKWTRFERYFQPLRASAKTLLLAEGKVSRQMFFVETGSLRTWVNVDGRDITTQFFFEGDMVSSIESFRTNKPSLYSIESIEPCLLQTISQEDFNALLSEMPELKDELLDHLFFRLNSIQTQSFTYLKNNPEQRYAELILQYPHIVKRVPQHHIASYLGITAVSLSRIRNRR